MKANAAQVGAAIDRGGGEIRLFLLHGPDEAGAAAYVERLLRALPGAERVDLDGVALKAQPGRLADEAASMSLFGDRRFVRVTGMGEESVEAVTLLLSAPIAGNPVVAIAPGVKTSGKLVKLALASSHAMALGCYPPEGQQAAQLAAALAREHGVRLLGDTAASLFAAAGGDRAVLTREIEKLALYLDAAPERPREADATAVAAVAASLEEVELGAAVSAVIDGRTDALGAELAGVAAASTEVPMLRALERRLITLAEMRGEVDRGDSPDSVVERHRVFWKEKPATVAALRRWDARQLAAALGRVRTAERNMMAGGGPVGSAAVGQDLLAITHRIGRR